MSSVETAAAVLPGAVADGIVGHAEAGKADLIVMGTHGRRGLGRLLTGSVAERVVREAPCPVVTVKAPADPVTPAGASVPALAARAAEVTGK